MGKTNAAELWSGRVRTGAVHFPRSMSRDQLQECAAAEALTAGPGGALAWKPIPGRPQNHRWDAACLAIHARHFRTLRRSRRPWRAVAV